MQWKPRRIQGTQGFASKCWSCPRFTMLLHTRIMTGAAVQPSVHLPFRYLVKSSSNMLSTSVDIIIFLRSCHNSLYIFLPMIAIITLFVQFYTIPIGLESWKRRGSCLSCSVLYATLHRHLVNVGIGPGGIWGTVQHTQIIMVQRILSHFNHKLRHKVDEDCDVQRLVVWKQLKILFFLRLFIFSFFTEV